MVSRRTKISNDDCWVNDAMMQQCAFHRLGCTEESFLSIEISTLSLTCLRTNYKGRTQITHYYRAFLQFGAKPKNVDDNFTVNTNLQSPFRAITHYRERQSSKMTVWYGAQQTCWSVSMSCTTSCFMSELVLGRSWLLDAGLNNITPQLLTGLELRATTWQKENHIRKTANCSPDIPVMS